MPRAPIIPNRHVILIPPKPHLRIMILRHEIEQVRQQDVTLIPRDAIDAAREAAIDIERLPARDRVRADDRVDRREGRAAVQRRAAQALAQRIAQARGLVEEEGRVVRGRQALEEALHGRRQAVVDLVARGPQRVAAAATGGQGVDLQHRVVGRHGLEGDV